MQEITYSTYQFYMEDGRRLAIFAKQIDYGRVIIWVIPCNKKDQFSKAKAKQILEDFREWGKGNAYHYTIDNIGNQKQFLMWCEKTYWKQGIVIMESHKADRKIITSSLISNNKKVEVKVLYKAN